jgi:hypothetical protein
VKYNLNEVFFMKSIIGDKYILLEKLDSDHEKKSSDTIKLLVDKNYPDIL